MLQLEAKRNHNTTEGDWFDEFDNVMVGKNAIGGGRKVMMKGSGMVKMEKDDNSIPFFAGLKDGGARVGISEMLGATDFGVSINKKFTECNRQDEIRGIFYLV